MAGETLSNGGRPGLLALALAAAAALTILLLASKAGAGLASLFMLGSGLAGGVLVAQAALGKGPWGRTLGRPSAPPLRTGGGGGENWVRRCFEELLGGEFPPTTKGKTLRWLQSSRGWPMEIDGYSSEYELGFEYQGPFHYLYNPIIDWLGQPVLDVFDNAWDLAEITSRELSPAEAMIIEYNRLTQTHKKFLEYLENDARKKALMAKHKQALLVIPYTVDAAAALGKFDLHDYIASRLNELAWHKVPHLQCNPVQALPEPPVDTAEYAPREIALEPSEHNLMKERGGLRRLKGSAGVVVYQPEMRRFMSRKFREVKEALPAGHDKVTIRGLISFYYVRKEKKDPVDVNTGLFFDAVKRVPMRVDSDEWVPMREPPRVIRLTQLEPQKPPPAGEGLGAQGAQGVPTA